MNFNDALEEVLLRDRDAVNAALRAEYSARCGSRPMVLFGAGPLGQIVLSALSEIEVQPVAFCDNNAARQGQEISGVRVLSPDAAIAEYSESAAFVVTIYNPAAVIQQLQARGCKCVVGAATLWRTHSEFENYCSFGTADAIFDQRDEVRRGFELLADEESRREYVAQLQWRTTPGFDAMPPQRPGKETYFPPEIALNNDEVFVDCGAFDGDTLRMVVERKGEDFKRFIGFEPDPDNFARLQNFISSLPTEQREKIEARNFATSNENGVVRFHATGTAGSGISGEGEIEMNCVRLDDALKNEAPTFIKMDIEGAEPNALQGARETIATHRPILAVCVYHESAHLWQIPQLIHDIVPDYNLYLRRYAEQCWELVVYGVPPERDS